jgi:hypothetical protein
MFPTKQEHRMADTSISSATSSASAFMAKQTADLHKAARTASTSFANTLNKVNVAIGLKPSTGFTAGPTYEATTLAGQTKAAFNSAVNATRSVLHIKP